MADESKTTFVYIYLPEQLEPDDREARYGDPLCVELELSRLGYVSGGGALYEAPDENGHREMIYCGVDVDLYDLDRGRALLRDHLPLLGCRSGTKLQWSEGDDGREDRFDGKSWRLDQPQERAA